MHVATASSDHSPEAYLSPRAVHTPFAHMTPPWQVANSPTYWPGRAFHGPPMMGPPVQAVPAASFFMPHPYPMATGLPPAMAIGPSMHFTAWPEVQIGNGYPGKSPFRLFSQLYLLYKSVKSECPMDKCRHALCMQAESIQITLTHLFSSSKSQDEHAIRVQISKACI